MTNETRKIYCYVDETGQDAGSEFFVVVVVAVKSRPEFIVKQLLEFEERVKLGNLKWHKGEHSRRIDFLDLFLGQPSPNLHIYFGKFKKPILYFFPIVETVAQAIKQYSNQKPQARMYIDGLDKISAKKITNTLRSGGLKLRLVKGVRDESEPLVRLADRWAGCIRMSFLGNEDCKRLVKKAEKTGKLSDIKTNPK